MTEPERRSTLHVIPDVDPVGLIRRGVRFPRLDQYVNDRPYVASSFLSVAIARVFGTALAGRCVGRPELPDEVLPLRARIAAAGCSGGEEILRRLFEPLGYGVHAVRPSAASMPDVRRRVWNSAHDLPAREVSPDADAAAAVDRRAG
jgi:hypothetical protein